MILQLDKLCRHTQTVLRQSTSEVITTILESVQATVPAFKINTKQIDQLNRSVVDPEEYNGWYFTPIQESQVYSDVGFYKGVSLGFKCNWLNGFSFHFPVVKYRKSTLSPESTTWPLHLAAEMERDPALFYYHMRDWWCIPEKGYLQRGTPPTQDEFDQSGHGKNTRQIESSTLADIAMLNLSHEEICKSVKEQLEKTHKRYVSKCNKAIKDADTPEKLVNLREVYLRTRFNPMQACYNKYTVKQRAIALNGVKL